MEKFIADDGTEIMNFDETVAVRRVLAPGSERKLQAAMPEISPVEAEGRAAEAESKAMGIQAGDGEEKLVITNFDETVAVRRTADARKTPPAKPKEEPVIEKFGEKNEAPPIHTFSDPPASPEKKLLVALLAAAGIAAVIGAVIWFIN